eukprot:jgi/Mesvir1/9736/Mv12200-RA.1
MKTIRQGLYIGDITDAISCLGRSVPGDKCNPAPSAVLSLCDVSGLQLPAVQSDVSQPAHMVVPLLDDDDADLLSHLPGCLDFIRQHLQISTATAEFPAAPGAAVVVHCHAGVSRSAAVLTAYLMVTERRSFADALASLQQASEGALPNDNFCQQLLLFERMGCTLDTSFPDYKQHRLASLAKKRLQGHSGASLLASDLVPATEPASTAASTSGGGGASRAVKQGLSLCQDVSVGAASQGGGGPSDAVPLASQGDPGGAAKRDLYRCRKCRALLLTSDNVMPHPEAKGTKPGGSKPAVAAGRSAATQCTSFFIEPLQWMATTVCDGDVEGDISCPKCKGKLGGFNWSGLKCSCGAWFTPGFRISTAKVDRCPF